MGQSAALRRSTAVRNVENDPLAAAAARTRSTVELKLLRLNAQSTID
jgi:hypothetical protein